MYIDRLIVEGGFLDGLDLSFVPGLNVIIGGRGTGKTSVIELTRFVLDVENFTESSRKRSLKYTLAVLEDGRATVVLAGANGAGACHAGGRGFESRRSRQQSIPMDNSCSMCDSRICRR